MRVFPLYGCTDGKKIYITRGNSQASVLNHVIESRIFPPNAIVYPMTVLPITAAKEYSFNHSAGWLYRKPAWLANREYEHRYISEVT